MIFKQNNILQWELDYVLFENKNNWIYDDCFSILINFVTGVKHSISERMVFSQGFMKWKEWNEYLKLFHNVFFYETDLLNFPWCLCATKLLIRLLKLGQDIKRVFSMVSGRCEEDWDSAGSEVRIRVSPFTIEVHRKCVCVCMYFTNNLINYSSDWWNLPSLPNESSTSIIGRSSYSGSRRQERVEQREREREEK